VSLSLNIEHKLFHAQTVAGVCIEEIQRYFDGNPGALMREKNSPADHPTFTFFAKKPIPARIPLLLGDALQNLRSALDYLVWELVISAGNVPTKQNQFPVCLTRKAFKDACKGGRLDGLDVKAIYIIEGLQLYYLSEAGIGLDHSSIAILDELVNINKHRYVLTTVLTTTDISAFQIIERDGIQYAYGPVIGDAQPRKFELPSAEAKTEVGVFMQIGEGYAKGVEVGACLNALFQSIGTKIVPLFEEFFS
jgi:hypothetical protein